MIENLLRVADIFAIFFFALGFYYFYTKQNRTFIENALFAFMVTGLVADTIFSIEFIIKK